VVAGVYTLAGAAYVTAGAYTLVGAAYVVVAGVEAKTNPPLAARGNKGATSTSVDSVSTAAGAGADFFFLVALFLDFLDETAAAMPMQQHNKAIRSAHATIGM